MKFSVFVSTSLDGFIARKNGSVDWLITAISANGAEDYGFKQFFANIDCMIMGRKTMEMILSHGQWPYEDKKVIIISNRFKRAPEAIIDKVEMYSGSLADLVTKLDSQGYQRISVDGGKTIQSFINESLINDLSITRVPVLLGEGRSLFGKLASDLSLKHINSKSYDNGFIHSHYQLN